MTGEQSTVGRAGGPGGGRAVPAGWAEQQGRHKPGS